MALTFTLDLEDHRPGPAHPPRFPDVTRDVLDRLDAAQVRGTFFVVGTVGAEHPDLVRAIAARGHELALHDWDHTQLDRTAPEAFRVSLHRGKETLEQLAQVRVTGYRAATFSLTAETTWATEVLAEAGFRYSSSVLAHANPLYGYPGAPSTAFRWPSGLVELPAPLIDLGLTRVPLGGTYLRLLPNSVMARRLLPTDVPFVYCHPYDFDVDEPFWWEPVSGALAPLLWVGRKRLWSKLTRLLVESAPPLCERIPDAEVLPEFDPDERATSRSQHDMIHRLPPARCVNRTVYLTERCRGRSVLHVGFVDQGYRDMQDRAGAWLHEHLAAAASRLVGVDVDAAGVAAARDAGYDAHVVDCRDADAVAAAGVEPAELVVAGEVIEHLDSPGEFLDGLHSLVAPDGRLVLTTPNAAGLFNTVAALANVEVNHPDHVVSFTWRTLSRLLADHGFTVEETATFVPAVKDRGIRAVGARAITGVERVAGRLGRPFLAEGLIVTCRPTRRPG